MTLLQDIVASATQDNCDLPSLLRKALVLAARLRNSELKTWLGYELNGYPEESLVPAYRRAETISYGFFADRFVGQATLQVPLSVLPEEFREKYKTVALQNPINALVDLHTRSKDEETSIELPWPPAARRFAQKVSPMECIKVWRSLNPSFVAGVVDTVKTRILLMALDLEVEDPAAGDVPSTHTALSEAIVSQIITTHIHGTVQNFSAGGDHVNQSAALNVSVGDVQSLAKALGSAGLESNEIVELTAAIAEDERQADLTAENGMGSRVKTWLGNLHVKAAQGLAAVGPEVVGGIITQAILLYFGLAK